MQESVSCSHSSKALGPIYLLVLFAAAYNLARVERWALVDGTRLATVVGGLLLIYAASRLIGQQPPSILTRIEFEDFPETATQRLGLSEPV